MQQFRAAPYLRRAVAEFWRRWHISLSTWFRDYLFTPLLGRALRLTERLRLGAESRELALAYLLAIVPTMALCGLWHGARWTFVAWGLLHGRLAGLAAGGWAGGGRRGCGRRPGRRACRRSPARCSSSTAWRPPSCCSARPTSARRRRCWRGSSARRPAGARSRSHVLVGAAATLALDATQAATGRPDWLADLRPWPRLVLAQLLVAVTIAAAAFRLYANPPFIYFQF